MLKSVPGLLKEISSVQQPLDMLFFDVMASSVLSYSSVSKNLEATP